MNGKKEAIQALHAFMKGKDKFLFLNGTHQNEKHPFAIGAVFQWGPQKSKVLFRSNSKSNTGNFLMAAGIKKMPAPGEYLNLDGSYLFTDTISPTSWRKSPRQIDAAIVYPLDSMDKNKGSECIDDLVHRGAKKIVMVTWTDNVDYSWVDHFQPARITYDAQEERPEYHEEIKDIEATSERHTAPRNLPNYAQNADPARLIKIHCRGCNKGSWAELNMPNPGLATIKKSDGYIATCLRCGNKNFDNYNW